MPEDDLLSNAIRTLTEFGSDNASGIAKLAKRKRVPTSDGDEDEGERKRKDKTKLLRAKTPEQRRADAQARFDAALRRGTTVQKFFDEHPEDARLLVEAGYMPDDDAPDEAERAVTKSTRRTDLDADEIADNVEQLAKNLRAQEPKLSPEGAVAKVLERYPHLYEEYVFAKEA